MSIQRKLRAVCVVLGFAAAVGMAAMAKPENGEETAARKRAQRETIETIAAPLLERLEKVENFRDAEVDFKIATHRLEAEIEHAGRAIQLREINLREYQLGYYPSEVQAREGDIKLAEADLTKAKDRLEHSDKMLKAGAISELQNQGDKLAVDKAEFTLLEAKNKLAILTNFTKLKRITELQADIEDARKFELDLKARADDMKSRHEAAARKVKADATLNDSEIRILFLLREAIPLQNENHLDQVQQKLDEASRLWQIEKDRLDQIHLLDTEGRLHEATRSLQRPAPKAE